MRDAPLTAVRYLAVGLGGVVLGIALVLGLQWLTAAGAPVPTVPGIATGQPTSGASSVPRIGLPNRARTPGAINAAATQDNLASTVCKSGWAASVRPPAGYTSALKLAQLFEYGYSDRDPSHYQEDHLVPLEVGGAPRDPRNLWPQPNVAQLEDGTEIGSKEKDDLEDELHRRVCDGSMTLADAQRAFAGDWIAAWEAAGRP